MLEFISSHQTGAVSNKQHFCKYLTSARPRETSLSICRTPRLLRRTRISEETWVQINRKLIKTLQFLEFSRDFMPLCSLIWSSKLPLHCGPWRFLAPLLDRWGLRQPGDFSGHIMTYDPLPSKSPIELIPPQLFPAYSRVTKNCKARKLPSRWCSTSSTINTFFPVFYSAQEHPQAAPLSSVSSCLDGLIWGFGFESSPLPSKVLYCAARTRRTLTGQTSPFSSALAVFSI